MITMSHEPPRSRDYKELNRWPCRDVGALLIGIGFWSPFLCSIAISKEPKGIIVVIIWASISRGFQGLHRHRVDIGLNKRL